jgi:hypothetical protein
MMMAPFFDDRRRLSRRAVLRCEQKMKIAIKRDGGAVHPAGSIVMGYSLKRKRSLF